MNKPLDLTKPVQTRDGRKVRILCTDAKGSGCPVVGLLTESSGLERPQCWPYSGRAFEPIGEHPKDLINVPVKRVVWLNVYRDCCGINESREEANKRASTDRIACVRVEFEEGEGL